MKEFPLSKEGSEWKSTGFQFDSFRVTNVLAASHLNTIIDLHDLVHKVNHAQFDPKKMNCLILRHRKIGAGRCVALVFSSGYISVNGSRSVCEARRNVRKYSRLIQSKGYEVKMGRIDIQSLSGTLQLITSKKIRLDNLAKMVRGQYEPELFSAMGIKKCGMTFLVFNSGKVVITGLKEEDENGHRVREMVKDIFPTYQIA